MNINKTHNTLVEVWYHNEDETESKNIATFYDTTINTVLYSSEINEATTLSIYKLTKKGKLKLIYSKEEQV